MKLRKDGTPDKRYSPKLKSNQNLDGATLTVADIKKVDDAFKRIEDPNKLHSRILKENGLELDFDVVGGTIETKHGIIKLDKPTLVVKAKYVQEG